MLTYLKEKIILDLYLVSFYAFWRPKNPFPPWTTKNKENHLMQLYLRFFKIEITLKEGKI
jgi:hypothetical protein